MVSQLRVKPLLMLSFTRRGVRELDWQNTAEAPRPYHIAPTCTSPAVTPSPSASP